ncbi:MAG: tRNA lysidine(34) synthetase TilS [Ktedonobacter sp. 13_2_20CM_2_54_8]|nr:MAG: tRNA lysidine(34) synthetase TilS [Ktedonobacter sp. 13_2_20CM_2_54_8]
MLEKIATYIDQHRLFPESGTIIVAVSGGADSLCLLHVLNRLCGSRPEARYPAVLLHVAHLNHKLRGEASYQDAAFIVQLADSWGLPVTIGEIDVPALARQEGRSLEDAARTARYRFLRDVAQGRLIAVAHHADDQVETLLLHWLRGEGLAGMVGMLPRQQDIIRPLLGVTHAETVAYCSQHALLPLEDTSNRDPRFLRNRVRHELLPLLESMNPGIHATLLRNTEVAHVDVAWIEAQVERYWPAVVLAEQEERITLDSAALLTLPLSLQRHLLRRVTARLCAGQSPLELRHYLLIEELLRREIAGTEEVTLQLPAQLQVTRNFTNLVFERLSSKEAEHIFSALDEAIPLPVPGRVAVPGTPWIASAEIVTEPVARLARQALQRQDWLSVWQFLPKTRYTVYIDADRAGPVLTVRTRRPGDRMRPLGMAREKKVQDMLVNEHIPGADRPYIPLFFSASHCVWLAGVQIDDRVRLTATTQRILRLSIEPSSVI